MPFVQGFLRIRKRGRPGQPLPDPEEPVDPDYGIDEGSPPGVWPGLPGNELPTPPPGIWPPLTPEHPWRPLPPGPPPVVGGGPARPPRPPVAPGQPLPGEEPEVEPPIVLPPGTIWPPLPPDVHGKFLALVLIAGTPGYAYRYVVVDADQRPKPEHPIATPPREPK